MAAAEDLLYLARVVFGGFVEVTETARQFREFSRVMAMGRSRSRSE
jgi:hypothetical protein